MKKPIKFIKLILLLIAFLLILFYAYYQTKGYLKGPILELTEPADGATLFQSAVTVKGFAKNIAYLSLNGRQIFTDPTGQFSEKILLNEGFNLVEITTKDKYERKNKKKLRLVYLDNSPLMD